MNRDQKILTTDGMFFSFHGTNMSLFISPSNLRLSNSEKWILLSFLFDDELGCVFLFFIFMVKLALLFRIIYRSPVWVARARLFVRVSEDAPYPTRLNSIYLSIYDN